mgnify:CR=1 FL=1
MRVMSFLQKSPIGVFIMMVLLGPGCTSVRFSGEGTPLPLSNIPAWHLLINADTFPEGWEADPCAPTDRLCFSGTHALRTFGRVAIPGHVIQQVYRFNSIEAAQAKFQRVWEVDFRPRQPPNMQFAPPPEITYRSPSADEYYFGCGVDRVPGCKALFRYGNYYIEFYFDLDEYRGYGLDDEGDGLRLEQVEPILRAMDEHAATVLGLRPRAEPTRTP